MEKTPNRYVARRQARQKVERAVLGCLVLIPLIAAATSGSGPRASTPKEVAPQAAQVDSQKIDKDLEKTNAVRSACWKYARSAVKSPRTLDGPESWINGNVNGEFVVIQPITAENSFGVRLSATAVCSGTDGVISKYELDER